MAFDWATAASVGGSLLGGALGGSSAKKEASKQRAMMREQLAKQEAMKMQIGQEYSPFITSGTQSQNKLNYLLGSAPEVKKDEYTLNDFIDSNRASLGAMGFNSRKLEGQATSDGTIQYQRYVDSGKKSSSVANSGMRALNQDEALDTSDGNYGSLLKEFTNEDFVKDAGYNFRQQEGEKGVNRAFSARGGYDSGKALKSLAKYNQDYASGEFNNAFNRDASTKGRIYDFLSGDANRGIGAVGSKASAFMGINNAQSQTAQNGMNASNAYEVEGANAMANGLQGAIGNLIYGMNRPKDSSIVSGGYSTAPRSSSSKPWYLE